jgi:DNA replication protein DnaD
MIDVKRQVYDGFQEQLEELMDRGSKKVKIVLQLESEILKRDLLRRELTKELQTIQIEQDRLCERMELIDQQIRENDSETPQINVDEAIVDLMTTFKDEFGDN